MSWVAVIWSMTASACLTLAAIHFLAWCQRRAAWDDLLFTLASVAVAVYAGCELWMMRAETPAEFATALRWFHVPGSVIIISLTGFVRFHLRAGRPWLGWIISALRALALLLNFLAGQNLNYREVTGLRHIPFLGEFVSVAEGIPNPCMLVGQLDLALLLVFVADATITVWRRGDRRQALVTGGSIGLLALAGIVQSVLVFWQILHWPIMASPFYLVLVVAMGYDLSRETLRAARLSDDLRESEARMTLAVEAAGFGVWMWTIASNRVWGSEQWRRLFGFELNADINYEMVFQQIHPDDREQVERAVARALQDRAGYSGEYRVKLPDGGQRWVSARGRVYLSADGKPSRMMGAALDITDRKQSEQQIAEQRNEVAHLSRVTTLGEISGSLAHELNQPLGAILVNTDAAELHLQSRTPNLDEVRAILEDIRKDGIRAGDIIHGMRAFLRRKELEMQPLEVGPMAAEAVKLISADAAARKTSVVLEIPTGLPRVMGDRVHLKQVLLNLLVNGMDAMSICLVADRRMTIRGTRPEPHTVAIAVSDAGVGIPPGELDQVFTPFHTTKQGGLGLGLSICRSIVEAHGGSISIKNNSDRGTTATVTLPAWVSTDDG